MFRKTQFKKSFKAIVLSLAVMLSASACGSGSGAGAGKNPVISGISGPTATFVNNDFILSMTLANVSIDAGLTVPIPHMPNSSIQVGPDLQSNGMLISVSLNVTDLQGLIKGVDFINPQTLPGGRPLPGVSAGEIPAIAVQVPKWDNMVFYVGTTVFGVFVPVKLGIQNDIATFRFYDTKGDDVGDLSIVGEDSTGANSGILLLIPIAGQVATILK
jgi:hypothetical protein